MIINDQFHINFKKIYIVYKNIPLFFNDKKLSSSVIRRLIRTLDPLLPGQPGALLATHIYFIMKEGRGGHFLYTTSHIFNSTDKGPHPPPPPPHPGLSSFCFKTTFPCPLSFSEYIHCWKNFKDFDPKAGITD